MYKKSEHAPVPGMRDPDVAKSGAALVARVMAHNERVAPQNSPKQGVRFELEANDHAKTCR